MSENYSSNHPGDHEPMPEGEEAAPPLVKPMAVIRWIILGVMSVFAVIMILSYFGVGPWKGSADAPTQYQCPMHPTYVANQPGECPICGMTLVPIAKDGQEPASADSTKAGTQDSAGATTVKYVCPMDPEVMSDQPGTCPKCGMDLEEVEVPKQPEPAQHSMDMGSSPVPGMVPVTIEPERLQLIGIRTAAVENRSLDGSLRLVGFVTPDETGLSNIHVRFSGWVRELKVDQTGQMVAKNDRLLSVYSQDLYQAEQDYLVARQALARVSDDSDLEDSRQQLQEAARRRLQLLGVPPEEQARLDSTGTPSAELWIRSPFAGVVLEKGATRGQFIGPDQNLFTIADLSKVWILADVYERDASRIRMGQQVRVTTAVRSGETFDGVISFLYPEVAPDTRTLKVRIELANPDRLLMPGMYTEVDLEGDGRRVLAVPSEAVMDGGAEQYAFVVHDGTHFEPRLLSIGQRSDDWMEVQAGLSEGEVVVTSANFLIDSESRLKAAMAGMGGTSAGAHAGHSK